MLRTVPDRTTGVDAAPRRRLGCVGAGLALAGGAGLGFLAAAVVDLMTTVEWRGAWTLGAMGGGAATVRTAVAAAGAGRPGVALGAVYRAMWTVGPDTTPERAVQFGLVGVLAWPVIAGGVRVRVGRPPLRPPWWAALWLYLGVPPATAVLLLRAGHRPGRVDGVIGAVVLLIPVAVWRFVRARRRPGE
jgi:hypothetical protein